MTQMTFDEFTKQVHALAGDIPCGACHMAGFNGGPTRYWAEVQAYRGARDDERVVRTEYYPTPGAALTEFAGVLEMIRSEHETWILKLDIAKAKKLVSDLGPAVTGIPEGYATDPKTTVTG